MNTLKYRMWIKWLDWKYDFLNWFQGPVITKIVESKEPYQFEYEGEMHWVQEVKFLRYHRNLKWFKKSHVRVGFHWRGRCYEIPEHLEPRWKIINVLERENECYRLSKVLKEITEKMAINLASANPIKRMK